MMMIEKQLLKLLPELFQKTFNGELDPTKLTFQATRKEFKGDITLVTFNLAKVAGTTPEATGQMLGEALVVDGTMVSGYNVVKGFLNIEIHNNIILKHLHESSHVKNEVKNQVSERLSDKPWLIEYSSPNTNKPLHLGHIRNNLLGFSVAEILKYQGYPVVKVNIVNDRGIHICKSMLAWQKYGEGETPESSGLKGDHLVGKYYVEFDRHFREQIAQLTEKGYSKEEAEKNAPLILEAQEMLRKWEAGDPPTVQLWEIMNNWVYDGFAVTYKNLGVDFDKIYYESKTYLLGKKIVEEGLQKGVLYKKNDSSVWVDLRDVGLDEKLLLRSDGTSVYMTQDIGTAVMRYEEYGFEKLIYVVGNEQDYHFKVLFEILRKLGYEWADKLYHLSYNMVDLPSGKMKSREGTVVDADDIMQEMVAEARKLTIELGKISDHDSEESVELYRTIGMGALKYFLLKVDPGKRMLFNPDESIDFNGNTGPFIQYSYARIRSVLRKARTLPALSDFESFNFIGYTGMNEKEKELVKVILKFDDICSESARDLSPAIMANYVYELSKSYNQFYHDHQIADPEHPVVSKFRLAVSTVCGNKIAAGMTLLGISVPERM